MPLRPNINPKLETMKFVPEDARHKICSVFPFEFNFNNQHGSYTLPAWNPTLRYTFVEVGPGWDKREFGNYKYLNILAYEAKKMAKDFVGFRLLQDGSFVESGVSQQYEARGVFVPEGKEPTDAEIEAATAKRNAWYQYMIDEADKTFVDTGKVKDIDSNAKMGARLLNEQRAWMKGVDKKVLVDCPSCGRPIKKGIVKCPDCHAILDKAKAAEYGFIPPAEPTAAQTAKGR